ncbi:4708_t:CDS:1, partial [Acaulospora morrowiae]
IPYYMDPKLKYSAGLPYLTKLKTRQQLCEMGYEASLIESTLQNLRNGIYPNQFYHAFGKSQVVDLSAIVSGKDI